MRTKGKELSSVGAKVVRPGHGTVPVNITIAPSNQHIDLSNTAAKHTYDAGYKKWEQFDADKYGEDRESSGFEVPSTALTPALLLPKQALPAASAPVPVARGVAVGETRPDLERASVVCTRKTCHVDLGLVGEN